MTLPNPLCMLRTWWRTVRYGASIGGCNLVDTELHRECYVRVSRCETCGHQVIAWQHGEPPDPDNVDPCCS